MQHRLENVVDMSAYLAAKNMQEENRQYRCYMTGERLEGHCEVLIYDCYRQRAEWFDLQFMSNGKSSHRYLCKEDVHLWMRKKMVLQITYGQAMILLGDLERIHQGNQPIPVQESIHVQRIWDGRYYDARKSSLHWLLPKLDVDGMIQLYLRALNNNDAVLLYDIIADEEKERMPRDLYIYNWHHILEQVTVFDYEMVWKEWQERQGQWNCFLTVYGETEQYRILSVDIQLQLMQEKDCLRIQSEQILEARKIFDHGAAL